MGQNPLTLSPILSRYFHSCDGLYGNVEKFYTISGDLEIRKLASGSTFQVFIFKSGSKFSIIFSH